MECSGVRSVIGRTKITALSFPTSRTRKPQSSYLHLTHNIVQRNVGTDHQRKPTIGLCTTARRSRVPNSKYPFRRREWQCDQAPPLREQPPPQLPSALTPRGSNSLGSFATSHLKPRGGSAVVVYPLSASSTWPQSRSSQGTGIVPSESAASEKTGRCRAKEPVHTSKATNPKSSMSLALVGCVELISFDDISRRVDSGRQLRESRSVLVPPSAFEVVEGERMYELPRPAMRGVPSLSTRISV